MLPLLQPPLSSRAASWVRSTFRLLSLPSVLPLLFLFGFLWFRFFLLYGYGYWRSWSVDLPSFYTASLAVFRDGVSPYDPATLQSMMQGKVYPYLYPPPSLLLFAPLSQMSYPDAKVFVLLSNHLWAVILILLLVFALFQQSPQHDGAHIALFFALFFFFHPLASTIRHGQVNLLLLINLVLFWWLARKEKPLMAGCFLSFAILIKAYPALLLLFLGCLRRWREIFWTVASLCASFLLAWLLLPSAVWGSWWKTVIAFGGYGKHPLGLFPPASVANQSFNGFFSRMFVGNTYLDPIIFAPLLGKILTYGSSVLVLGLSAWIVYATASSSSRSDALDRTMVLTLPVTFLVAPFSWQHHLVTVLPSLFWWILVSFSWTGLQGFVARFVLFLILLLLALRGTWTWKFYGVLALWLGLFITLAQTLTRHRTTARHPVSTAAHI